MTSENRDVFAPGGADSRYGTVGRLADGRSFVMFERCLPAPVDAVWAAITEPDQRAAWFPGFELECRVGGRFSMRFDGNCDGPAEVGGRVTRFEPPRVLECETMCWELRPEGNGCRLRFTDILQFTGPRSRSDVTNAVLAGWHRYLDLFEDAVAGRVVDLSRPEPDYAKIDVVGR